MIHKSEALRAIDHSRQQINLSADKLDGLTLRIIQAHLEYASEQVEAIVEVKRVRKAKGVIVITDPNAIADPLWEEKA